MPLTPHTSYQTHLPRPWAYHHQSQSPSPPYRSDGSLTSYLNHLRHPSTFWNLQSARFLWLILLRQLFFLVQRCVLIPNTYQLEDLANMFLTDRHFTSVTWNLFISLFLPGLLYLVIVCVRRVYFHPLSQFPGPRLAAVTRWYEFYFDIIKGGIFSKQFPALHQKYGTLIPFVATSDSSLANHMIRTNCSYFTRPTSCEWSRVLQDVCFLVNSSYDKVPKAVVLMLMQNL